MVGAQNVPLDFFVDLLGEIDMTKTYAIHCKGGYRSVIAASILQSKGVKGTIDLVGGFDVIKETKVALNLPELA